MSRSVRKTILPTCSLMAVAVDNHTSCSFANECPVANEQGSFTTPSFVSFTDKERLIGESAKNQAAMNPKNTIFDIKSVLLHIRIIHIDLLLIPLCRRLIGRRFDDVTVKKDIESWPFTVIDRDGSPMVEVEYLGETKVFSPQEISAMVLTKASLIYMQRWK